MATSRHLEDIDEQFLQCPMCLERLKEPKMLPCLHRYCRDCLHQTVKEEDTKLCCPTCREEHSLPEGGVDGYKTDFNTRNIVEYIELQESVEAEPLRVCAGCTTEQRVTGFCFKCDDFLCQGCHEYHKSIKILKDHQDHIFSLREAEARKLTIRGLSSLKEPPRCQKHPAKLSELCCTTCGNEPICMVCTYGAHKGHDLQEVATLAETLRGELKGKLADAMECKERLLKRKEKIQAAREKLDKAVMEKQRKLQQEAKAEEDKTKREIVQLDGRMEELKAELEKEKEAKMTGRKQELERIIKDLEEEYERACKEDQQEADAQFKKLQEESEVERKKLEEGLDTIKEEIEETVAAVTTEAEENTKRINGLHDNLQEAVTKFEDTVLMSTNILAAEHDWTDVQCIKEVCRAIDPLVEEAKKEYPDLGRLSSITAGRVSVHISEREESVVDIEGVDYTMQPTLPINTIAVCKGGSIVITGREEDTQHKSDIMVIDIGGRQLRQDSIKSDDSFPWAYCAPLSEFEVAIANRPHEVGVYNIREGTYRKRRIPKNIGSWPKDRGEVCCITTNSTENHIIVGGFHSRELYVFTGKLEYAFKLTMPEMIKWCRGVAIKGAHILVCDYEGGKAYAVERGESPCELGYEFARPDVVGGNWKPRSVCTDKQRFIYMLWVTSEEDRSLVVQYKQDGGQILATRLLDQKQYAKCITIMETELGEKLLIPTCSQLVTFRLEVIN